MTKTSGNKIKRRKYTILKYYETDIKGHQRENPSLLFITQYKARYDNVSRIIEFLIFEKIHLRFHWRIGEWFRRVGVMSKRSAFRVDELFGESIESIATQVLGARLWASKQGESRIKPEDKSRTLACRWLRLRAVPNTFRRLASELAVVFSCFSSYLQILNMTNYVDNQKMKK